MLDRWLNRVGFRKGNPFGTNEAEQEPFVPECFVDPGVYDFLKGDPRSTLVFAPRGGGKTALRVMLASDCRPFRKTSVGARSRTLAVTYTDFGPALHACEHDLTRLTAAHHVTQILGASCSTFLEALGEDEDLVDALSPPDRSLLAGYCAQFDPSRLSADVFYRHLRSDCPAVSVAWSDLRRAVSERRLETFLREQEVNLSPCLCLYAQLIDDIATPLASVDSPVALLRRFVQLVRSAGLEAVFVLIDRLDERFHTFDDPDQLADLIAPLITNLPLMEIPDVAFKFFLPRTARDAVMTYVRPERLRTLDVQWTREKLRDLLRLRIQVYSQNKIKFIGRLCSERLSSRIEKEMIEVADGSPRRLLQLGAALLESHIELNGVQRVITEEAWAETPTKVLGQRYVRRLWVDRQAAQVYLGETTPVQLAPLPYRLLLYLYESRGYRTNEEIKEGVWPDEHYTTDDTVRQTIRRVREALEEAGVDPHEYLVNKPGRGYKLQHIA